MPWFGGWHEAGVGQGTKMIRLKRAYEPASRDDGLRILVERLWPRGVSKRKAQIDLWLKDLAPSTELRRWYSWPAGLPAPHHPLFQSQYA